MASGLASTTRFIGIIAGVAGLGAVLAAISERTLVRLGGPLVTSQAVDWHSVSLRIVGGDIDGALSNLPVGVRFAIAETVRGSIAAGFGAAFSVASVVALLASFASWRLVRPASKNAT